MTKLEALYLTLAMIVSAVITLPVIEVVKFLVRAIRDKPAPVDFSDTENPF